MSDISLTAAQRSSLISLLDIQSLSDTTQLRLSTGRRVNSASDDAVSFFRARSLSDRADDFALRQDDIAQGVHALQVTINALDSVDALLRQVRGVAESSRSQTDQERVRATEQFGVLIEQISDLIEDSSYQGLNLLNNTTNELNVRFGVTTSSRLVVDGLALNTTAVTGFNNSNLFSVIVFSRTAGNLRVHTSRLLNDATGLGGGFTLIGSDNSNVGRVEGIVQNIDNAIGRLRAQASQLGTNNAILQTRAEFTQSYVTENRGGADGLILADLNEEGANIVVLQTRQQLAINSLAIAGRQQQSILQLIS